MYIFFLNNNLLRSVRYDSGKLTKYCKGAHFYANGNEKVKSDLPVLHKNALPVSK